jgi:hypothetical protein
VYAVEVRAIRRRQDHDGREDDRRRTERREFSGQAGRLPRRTRDDDADARERPRRRCALRERMHAHHARLVGDEPGGAARQECVGERAAQLLGALGIGDVGVEFAAQDVAAVAAREKAAQP